jgi:TP901 family phage tail tape measure protein
MPPVRIELIADIQRFMASMKRAEGELDKFGNKATTRAQALGKLGDKLATGVLMAGAAVAVTSVKMAMDFQTSVTRLETGAGEAHANIKLIHDGILAMAGDVAQTPKALADGMYMIASAGFHGAEGLKVLNAAAQGAAVGGADMMTVADGLTTVLNNYNLSADKAVSVTSALIQTVALGKTNLGDLSTALAKVSPTGAALGLTYKDIGGAMATMTAQGVKADMAAERLNTMMLGLATPGEDAVQILNYIGLSAQKVKDSMGKRGLAATISMIEDHLGKKIPKSSAAYNDAMQRMMGGQTGYTASLLLTGSHMKTFQENTKKIGETMDKSTKKVQGMAEVQKTLKFQLDKLKSAGTAALIGIGEFLLPKITVVAQWATGVMDYFKKHPLISHIASDAALAAFGIALGVKMKKAFSAVKDILGFGKQAAQIAATTANTVALDANTAALLGTAGGGLIPKTPKKLASILPKAAGLAGRLIGGGAGAAGLAAGAFAGAGALGLAYAAQHPLQKLPPEFANGAGRSRPDLQYAKLTKAYQAFHAKGGTDADWTKQKNAFIASGHTNAEWLAGGASIVMPKPKPVTPPKAMPSRSGIPIAPPSRVPSVTPTTPAHTGLPSRSGGAPKTVTVKIH